MVAGSQRRLTRGLTDLRLSELREDGDHIEAVQQLERLEKTTMFLNVGMVPQLKIEVLSSRSLDIVWLTMGLVALFTLIASSVSLATIGIGSEDGDIDTQVAVVCLSGTVHVVTAVIVVFVVVAYPQRIIRKLVVPGNSKPLPEQLLVVGVVLFLFGSPITSFWGAGWFWVSTRKALEENPSSDFLLHKLSFDSMHSLKLLSLVSAVMSYMCIAMFGVLAELTRVILRSAEMSFASADTEQHYEDSFQHAQASENGTQTHTQDQTQTQTQTQTQPLGKQPSELSEGASIQSSEPTGGPSEPIARMKTRQKRPGPRRDSAERSEVFSEGGNGFSPFGLEAVVQRMRRLLEKQLWDERGYKELLYMSKLGFFNVSLAIALVIFNSIYATRLNVISNVVPLMGIITVIRVCTSEGSPCADDRVFSRAVGAGVIFLLEFGLLFSYSRLLQRAKRALWRVPYSVTRPQQVSFLFYALQSLLLCSLIGFLGILVVSITSVDFWLYRPIRNAQDEFELVYDPLYQVGLTGASISINYYGFYLVVSSSLMAMAYLPADSVGVRGCFCPMSRPVRQRETKELRRARSQMSGADLDIGDSLARLSALGKAHETSAALTEQQKENALLFFRERLVVRRNLRLEDQERPVYIMSEEGARKIQHVVPLLALTRLGTEVSSTSSRRLRNLEVSESWRELASMARAEIVGEPSIVTTVRDLNVMILETEILAFNFTVVTYFLGRKRGEMSFEEEAALIESPAFSLEEHIIDDDIDTHCLVASSDDRVFVAFRGTASEANARTDLAMQLVPWDLANDVELVNDLQNAQESLFAKRGLTAHVHRGFLEAYGRIRDQIRAHIERLAVDQYGNQIRAVFCTGHSLGAGLATLCAFDLGALLRKRTNRVDVAIACTTFGSPRCGNFVFRSRYNLLVPKTNRFVNAGDIIPKGPPRNLLRALTLKGYRHVGRQVLMDGNGRFIISPSRIERFLQHGNLFYGNKPKSHTTMRYAYSLLLWCIMAHFRVFDPDLWHVHMEMIDSIGRSRKQYMNAVVRERYNEVIRNKGFRYRVGRTEVRDMGMQTEISQDGDEFPAQALLDQFRRIAQVNPNDPSVRSVLDRMHHVIDHIDHQDTTHYDNDDEVTDTEEELAEGEEVEEGDDQQQQQQQQQQQDKNAETSQEATAAYGHERDNNCTDKGDSEDHVGASSSPFFVSPDHASAVQHPFKQHKRDNNQDDDALHLDIV